MNCPKCGEELPDDSTFCGFCGGKIEPQPESPVAVREEAPAFQGIKPKPRGNLPAWAWVLIGVGGILVIGVGVVLMTRGTPGGSSVDVIAGRWSGNIASIEPGFSDTITVEIEAGCEVGAECGTFRIRDGHCVGNLRLASIEGDGFWFEERTDLSASASNCSGDSGWEFLRSLSGNRLEFNFSPSSGGAIVTRGVLEGE